VGIRRRRRWWGRGTCRAPPRRPERPAHGRSSSSSPYRDLALVIALAAMGRGRLPAESRSGISDMAISWPLLRPFYSVTGLAGG
jgi:hypothetical protein